MILIGVFEFRLGNKDNDRNWNLSFISRAHTAAAIIPFFCIIKLKTAILFGLCPSV